MAKFDLYEHTSEAAADQGGASYSTLQFAGAVALWFLLVFFVGFLVLGG